jgi:signal peptidase I
LKIRTLNIVSFIIFALLLSFFAVWIRFYWLLVGNIILLDIFITQLINWKYPEKLLSRFRLLKEVLEWAFAVVSAIVLVIFIRTFIIEAYTIPTPSMEKTLMVGDYLFVSKISYGPKLPNTPIAFPFAHNTMPFSHKKSYNEKVQWPYRRLAGIGQIKNNDVVVFNFPEGDTVITEFPDQNYYSLIRKYGRKSILDKYHLIVRPIDKRENFVKRCIGIPGDTLQITHTSVYINNLPLKDPDNVQYNYYIRTTGEKISGDELAELDINAADQLNDPDEENYVFSLTRIQANGMRIMSNISKVTRLENTSRNLSYLSYFPYDTEFSWNEDNFGPLVVPKKGTTVKLTLGNLPLYRRIIEVYEKNKLEVKDGKIFINNIPSDTYRFLMNYYFMMGDNRHNSADSRIWGFVPEDHIVGKAVLVWLSIDKNKKSFNKIRWNRMFKKIL